MELDEYLSERLGELKEERVITTESLDIIRDKIQKADKKRGTQDNTDNYHKWSSILRGLESELDKAKILITSIDAETAEKSEKLAEYVKKKTEEREYKEKRLLEIHDMDPDELAALPLEDMALLQDYELSLVEPEEDEEDDEEGEESQADSAPVIVSENPGPSRQLLRTPVSPEHAKMSVIEPAPTIPPKAPQTESPTLESPNDVLPSKPKPLKPPSTEDRAFFGEVLKKFLGGRLGDVTLTEAERFVHVAQTVLLIPANDERSERVQTSTRDALNAIRTMCQGG